MEQIRVEKAEIEDYRTAGAENYRKTFIQLTRHVVIITGALRSLKNTWHYLRGTGEFQDILSSYKIFNLCKTE